MKCSICNSLKDKYIGTEYNIQEFAFGLQRKCFNAFYSPVVKLATLWTWPMCALNALPGNRKYFPQFRVPGPEFR